VGRGVGRPDSAWGSGLGEETAGPTTGCTLQQIETKKTKKEGNKNSRTRKTYIRRGRDRKKYTSLQPACYKKRKKGQKELGYSGEKRLA